MPIYVIWNKKHKNSVKLDSISNFNSNLHTLNFWQIYFHRFQKRLAKLLYKAQPGHVKTGQVDIFLAVLLGWIRHSHNLLAWFWYKSTPFYNAQVCVIIVLS